MKIRISDRSLRLRLNDDDIDLLKSSGELRQTLPTGPRSELAFCLRTVDGLSDWTLNQIENAVVVSVPAKEFQPWLEGQEIECEKNLVEPSLRVMIEKDIISSRRQSL